MRGSLPDHDLLPSAVRKKRTTLVQSTLRSEIVAAQPEAERRIRGGDVILLHDGCNVAMGWDRSHSVEATELIITQWKEQQGFAFATIPEMIERTGFVVP